MQEFSIKYGKKLIRVKFSVAENAPTVEDALVKILSKRMDEKHCGTSGSEL